MQTNPDHLTLTPFQRTPVLPFMQSLWAETYCALVKHRRGGSVMLWRSHAGAVLGTISWGKGASRVVHDLEPDVTAELWQRATGKPPPAVA